MYNKKLGLFWLINIICPIIIGGFGYYLLCPNSFWACAIDKVFSVNVHIENDFFVYKLVRNYLFDGLWVYSLVYAISWFYGIGERIWYICAASVSLGIIFELLQRIGIFYGTFDFIDICVEMISGLFAGYIIKKVCKEKVKCEELREV